MSRTTASEFDVGSFLRKERAAVDGVLSRVLDEALGAVPAAVAEPIRYAVESGGKRIRPILCVAAYRAARQGARRPVRGSDGRASGAAEDGVYRVAAAIELIHTYSLVHDDLPCMDDDDLRRGRPSAHRAFGDRRAIAAGAAFIPLAVRVAADGADRIGLAADQRMAIVRELTLAAGATGMVGGQLADLEAEGGESTLESLEGIHRRKTGALLAASLRIGALAARAGTGVLDEFGEFGRAIGLAFQMADDVLDVTGTAEVLGKTAGKDVESRKATYAALLGVEGARRRARAEAERAAEALRGANMLTPELGALAQYAVERDR